MSLRQEQITRTAEKYCDIPYRNRSSKNATLLLSNIKSLIEEELGEIEDKKKALIYHLQELENLYEDGDVDGIYYNKAHDDMQNKIHTLEDRHRLLLKGMHDPSLLVKNIVELRLSTPTIVVIVEFTLILLVLYIYYKMSGQILFRP